MSIIFLLVYKIEKLEKKSFEDDDERVFKKVVALITALAAVIGLSTLLAL